MRILVKPRRTDEAVGSEPKELVAPGAEPAPAAETQKLAGKRRGQGYTAGAPHSKCCMNQQ